MTIHNCQMNTATACLAGLLRTPALAVLLLVAGFTWMTPGTAFGQVTPGCTDDSAFNYDPTATEDDGSCVFNPCFNQTACNFDPELEWNEGPCVFAEDGYDCDGNCLADDNDNGICDALEVEGCTDSSACNYDANATFGDNNVLCDYSSCFVFGARFRMTTSRMPWTWSCSSSVIVTSTGYSPSFVHVQLNMQSAKKDTTRVFAQRLHQLKDGIPSKLSVWTTIVPWPRPASISDSPTSILTACPSQ